jgi:RHS repeat-associated protein
MCKPIAFNKAKTIKANGSITELSYDANQKRAMQRIDDATGGFETTYYVGGGYEYVEEYKNRQNIRKIRINLVAAGEHIGVYVKSLTNGVKNVDRLRYFHRDALGNIDLITDKNGQIVARQDYAPFGSRTQNLSKDVISDETRRGFTGHEHIDGAGLINMNARMYDPLTGRFLSADIYIQEPTLSLSHNRYIYVMNNPLKYTDPTGHFWQFIVGAAIAYITSHDSNPYVRMAGMIIGGAMMGGANVFGAAHMMANKVAAGFVMGGISSGDFKGAVIGGLSAGLTYGVGHGGLLGDSANWFETALGHGVVQGMIAEAQGNDFQSGFASGFIGHVSGVAVGGLEDTAVLAGVVGRTTIAAVFGGLASEATGGSFEDGALQAAVVHLFNQEVKKELTKRELLNRLSSNEWADLAGQIADSAANMRKTIQQMPDEFVEWLIQKKMDPVLMKAIWESKLSKIHYHTRAHEIAGKSLSNLLFSADVLTGPGKTIVWKSIDITVSLINESHNYSSYINYYGSVKFTQEWDIGVHIEIGY